MLIDLSDMHSKFLKALRLSIKKKKLLKRPVKNNFLPNIDFFFFNFSFLFYHVNFFGKYFYRFSRILKLLNPHKAFYFLSAKCYHNKFSFIDQFSASYEYIVNIFQHVKQI